MPAIDDHLGPAAGRGLPPITAAARRAERTAAALALADRLGRTLRPAAVVPVRPATPVGISAPRARIPAAVIDGLVHLSPPSAPSRSAPAAATVEAEPRPPTIAAIIAAVADHYGLTRIDLLSQRRSRAVARPRQLAMWLAATLTPASLPQIGRRFGDRDHTTVLHARRVTAARLAVDPDLRADADALISRLTGSAR